MSNETDQPTAGGQAGNEQTAKKGLRAAYSAPKLNVYGSVRELTGTFSGVGPGDGATMMTAASDPAVKENIVQVGAHPAGFGLYLFDYKPEFRDSFGHGRQFGVLADEVELIVPEAVGIDESGYRNVDYARLGIVRH
jgi:hypothetical protein